MTKSDFTNDVVVINRTVVDAQTGEILSKKKYANWTGWKDDEYKYRYRNKPLKLYLDMEWDLTAAQLRVFLLICNYMNSENLFIEFQKSIKKYKVGKFVPLTKDDIYENVKDKIARITFERAWKGLLGKYIKKIDVNGMKVWAVNPAFASKLDYLPLYMYVPFKEYIDPFLTIQALKKYQSMELNEYK